MRLSLNALRAAILLFGLSPISALAPIALHNTKTRLKSLCQNPKLQTDRRNRYPQKKPPQNYQPPIPPQGVFLD
jgi:hypothetical protein